MTLFQDVESLEFYKYLFSFVCLARMVSSSAYYSYCFQFESFFCWTIAIMKIDEISELISLFSSWSDGFSVCTCNLLYSGELHQLGSWWQLLGYLYSCNIGLFATETIRALSLSNTLEAVSYCMGWCHCHTTSGHSGIDILGQIQALEERGYCASLLCSVKLFIYFQDMSKQRKEDPVVTIEFVRAWALLVSPQMTSLHHTSPNQEHLVFPCAVVQCQKYGWPQVISSRCLHTFYLHSVTCSGYGTP